MQSRAGARVVFDSWLPLGDSGCFGLGENLLFRYNREQKTHVQGAESDD